MEAMPASELPVGPEWQYEPKWDGFRCLAFRDHDRVDLMSKAQKPLTRYFPELVEALFSSKAEQFVLDGEIVIPADGALSFDQLLMRIHPAASRIRKLSESSPAILIVFEWEPLAPKLVAEVQFDHFTGGRFRHGTKFLRWRPEKAPHDCTMKQVVRENRSALDLL
jgi:ATP-dependent DNA ligase